MFCDLPRAEWDFRDVPSAELKAACVWEAARESTLLTSDHSILEWLPSSPAIDWLLELRGLFGASDFLSCPWMQAIGRYRQWSLLHRWLLSEVYGPLEPGGERRGREKVTDYQAWLRAIGVGRLRKWGLTFAQIVDLYRSVGIVDRDWERLDELERFTRQQTLERVIKRDAAKVDGLLLKLLPSVFA